MRISKKNVCNTYEMTLVVMKWILMKKYGKTMSSFIWLKIGAIGGIL
jgi:hypothetical protein